MYLPSLNFKTCHFSYWVGSRVTVGILLLYLHFSLSLSQFQPTFVSFVTIYPVLKVAVSRPCHLSKCNSNRASCLGERQMRETFPILVLGFWALFPLGVVNNATPLAYPKCPLISTAPHLSVLLVNYRPIYQKTKNTSSYTPPPPHIGPHYILINHILL